MANPNSPGYILPTRYGTWYGFEHNGSKLTQFAMQNFNQQRDENGNPLNDAYIVIYDDDIETMKEIIDAAKEAGISAVIASDVAVMAYCNEVGEEVHLSTQLNISNVEALKFYSRFADVSVLARELNMDQVKHIHEEIEKQNICGPMGKQIRIEMFCL